MNMSETTNRKIHLVNVIVFCGILLLGGIASLTMKKDSVSVMENRKLATFPNYSDSSFWKGKYFKDIEAYYADNFPLRDSWISFATGLRDKFGFQSSEIKMYDEANITDVPDKTDTIKKETSDGPLPDDGATGQVKKKVVEGEKSDEVRSDFSAQLRLSMPMLRRSPAPVTIVFRITASSSSRSSVGVFRSNSSPHRSHDSERHWRRTSPNEPP